MLTTLVVGTGFLGKNMCLRSSLLDIPVPTEIVSPAVPHSSLQEEEMVRHASVCPGDLRHLGGRYVNISNFFACLSLRIFLGHSYIISWLDGIANFYVLTLGLLYGCCSNYPYLWF